jgi:hypothetical protein
MKTTLNLRAFAKWSILEVAIIMVSGWQIKAQTNIAPIISTNQNTVTPEIREVNGQSYDVSKPPFILVTIPVGSALVNAKEIHYNPDAPKPCKVINLQIPAIYNFSHPVILSIGNFPYSPSYFQNGYWQTGYRARDSLTVAKERIANGTAKDINKQKELKQRNEEMGYGMYTPDRYETKIDNGLVTKEPIALRLFPLHPARTNFNAVGEQVVIPAKPIFDYGTPVK